MSGEQSGATTSLVAGLEAIKQETLRLREGLFEGTPLTVYLTSLLPWELLRDEPARATRATPESHHRPTQDVTSLPRLSFDCLHLVGLGHCSFLTEPYGQHWVVS